MTVHRPQNRQEALADQRNRKVHYLALMAIRLAALPVLFIVPRSLMLPVFIIAAVSVMSAVIGGNDASAPAMLFPAEPPDEPAPGLPEQVTPPEA